MESDLDGLPGPSPFWLCALELVIWHPWDSVSSTIKQQPLWRPLTAPRTDVSFSFPSGATPWNPLVLHVTALGMSLPINIWTSHQHPPWVRSSLLPFSKAPCVWVAAHSTCLPPSSTDRGDVPSSRLVAAAVHVPELPHAAQDGSRGNYSLLIIIDRNATRRRLNYVPGAQGRGLSELALTLMHSGGLLRDSRDMG